MTKKGSFECSIFSYSEVAEILVFAYSILRGDSDLPLRNPNGAALPRALVLAMGDSQGGEVV
jgi:hypothetical protein